MSHGVHHAPHFSRLGAGQPARASISRLASFVLKLERSFVSAALWRQPPRLLPSLLAMNLPRSENIFRMNTYVKSRRKPTAINTYKNTGLKVEQNQHLQKNRGAGVSR